MYKGDHEFVPSHKKEKDKMSNLVRVRRRKRGGGGWRRKQRFASQ